MTIWWLPGVSPGISRGKMMIQKKMMAVSFLYEILIPFLTPASLPKMAFPGYPALGCFLVELNLQPCSFGTSVVLLGLC